MNTRTKILNLFREGKTTAEVSKLFSVKTTYRYFKLYLLIKIRNTIQTIVDNERFDVMNVPTLKNELEEIKSW